MEPNTSHIPDGPLIRETEDLTRYWDMIETKYGIDRDELDPEEETRISPSYHPLTLQMDVIRGELAMHDSGELELTPEELQSLESSRKRMEGILESECFVFPVEPEGE